VALSEHRSDPGDRSEESLTHQLIFSALNGTCAAGFGNSAKLFFYYFCNMAKVNIPNE
jgi:hypothetical protein